MTGRSPRGKEFFTTRSVAEVLEGFRPARRTASEVVPLAAALGRVPASALLSPTSLPGFARSTVDGYAVLAADTHGASEGVPSYLDVVGAVRMGVAPVVEVRSGAAVQIPTGAPLPVGADAVVMVEHTDLTTPALVEVTRPVATGDGVVRHDEDVATGAALVPGGRPLRAQDLGLLAAAGLVEVPVLVRPRVAIISTGDEVVPPETAELSAGQVRDATASALAGLVTRSGGVPMLHGIVPDDLTALTAALATASADADVVVVSAGSSVGARDETVAAVQAMPGTEVFCHGVAVKPGKPTLLAEAAGVPVLGLPGNPLSALVVFRLLGVPLLRLVGGITSPPPEPTRAARLTRSLASQAGRLDVVQVRVDGDRATPLFGHSALLTLLTAADGYLVVPEPATGLDEGHEVGVTLYD